MNTVPSPQATLPGSVLVMLVQRAGQALQPLLDAARAMRACHQRARSLERIADLDDHILDDIGVTRAQIEAIRLR